MLVFALMFVSAGLLFIALAVPLMLRRVRPNGLYGLRVPATFQDERVWYDANAASGRDLALLGACVVAVGLGSLVFPWEEQTIASFAGPGLVAAVIVLAIVGWRRANRMLRARVGGGAQERHS